MTIKAVLFDMDGVLVDSERYHVEAFVELFKRHGVKLTAKDTAGIFGQLDEHIIEDLCKRKKVPCTVAAWGAEKRTIATDLMRKSKMFLFPGVKSMLALVKKKYKVGLATSSSRAEAEIVLLKIGLRNSFDAILTREDVHTHKPSPEIYTKLSERFKCLPEECVVIEDSITGVTAAKRANMRCIAVLNTFPAAKLKEADLVVKRLDDQKVQEFLS